MDSTHKLPEVVKRCIAKAEKAKFHWMDQVLLGVLKDKEYSETLESIEVSGGWEYLLYLYEYKTMRQSVIDAWDHHNYTESQKNN